MNHEPLTIVIILDHASVTGGQAKVALDSALGLKRVGHNPIVFAATKPIDPRLVVEEIDVVCLDQKDLLAHTSKIVAGAQGIWNFTAGKKLATLLASLPKARTIVHVHGWAKALSPSIAVHIRRSGLPAVYTMHDYFLYCPNGALYNFQQQHVCKLTPLSSKCWTTNCDARNYPDKLWRATRTAVMKNVARLPQVFSDIILISDLQKAVLADYFSKGVIIHQISNPIEAEDLGPKQNPASGGFLFAGRVSPEKGVFCFAEAAKKVNIAPVFVGDGPAARLLQERYPAAQVLGWKSPVQVKQFMRAARALVFPSVAYEGQPLAVLEAKALGTPVIVSNGCAGREEVEDGISGLWFETNNSNSLATALRQLCNDDTVSRMSRAAYNQFWLNAPTLDRHVAHVSRLYEEILERRRASS